MRRATFSPTIRPTRVEPVKLISGTRTSSTSCSDSAVPASLTRKKMSGKPPACSAALHILIAAMAVSGVLLDGFHTHTSPHTAARKAFQLHTATGKLNALMMPTRPSGWYCSYMRWPGRSECMV